MQQIMKLNAFDSDPKISSHYNHINLLNLFLMEVLDRNHIFESLVEIIIKTEKINELQLADYSYREVKNYLLIACTRIKDNKRIEGVLSNKNLKKSSKFKFANDLAEEIESQLNITFNNREILELISMLRTQSYIINNSKIIDSVELQIIINDFIYSVSKDLSIQYYLNTELYEMLENHLKILFKRLREGFSLENPMESEIREKYDFVFNLVRKHIKKFENFSDLDLNDSEVSYVVIYFLAILESNVQENIVLNAVLICNSGRGTAQLLKAKIESNFPQINIVKISSVHGSEISSDDVDIFISTVPFSHEFIPTVVVSPILTEENIHSIQQGLLKIKNRETNFNENDKNTGNEYRNDKLFLEYIDDVEKHIDINIREDLVGQLRHVYHKFFASSNKKTGQNFHVSDEFLLSKYLDTENISINNTANDWKSAIRQSGELLERSKYIEKTYTDAMIRISEENNSYIVIYPNVAIPHALESDGAIKDGISLVKLSNPVVFNHELNDPVRYVIAFSIKNSFWVGKVLYNLLEMLNSGNLIERLDACTSEDEVMKVIIDIEREFKAND